MIACSILRLFAVDGGNVHEVLWVQYQKSKNTKRGLSYVTLPPVPPNFSVLITLSLPIIIEAARELTCPLSVLHSQGTDILRIYVHL